MNSEYSEIRSQTLIIIFNYTNKSITYKCNKQNLKCYQTLCVVNDFHANMTTNQTYL